jgi:hypothetical protein
MTGFEKFPSIDNFHNVNRRVKMFWTLEMRPTIRYRAKIKLHGTNAGIRIMPDGNVVAQTRTTDLVDREDNHGFNAWLQSGKDYWSTLARDERLVVFGEWAGPGIQKKASVSRIQSKSFFVFAVLFNGESIITDPSLIEKTLGDDIPDRVRILPWHGDEIEIDFSDIPLMEKKLEAINKEIESIDKEDPYIKDTFGVSGPGEGLVYTPINVLDESGIHFRTHFDETAQYKTTERESYSEFTFKVKGEKHKVLKDDKAQAAMVDPIVAASIQAFVSMTVTQARLEQALQEACDDDPNVRKMGDFLKWVGTDIQKECVAELEAAGLDWKQVGKAVNKHAKNWLISESNKLGE